MKTALRDEAGNLVDLVQVARPDGTLELYRQRKPGIWKWLGDYSHPQGVGPRLVRLEVTEAAVDHKLLGALRRSRAT